MPDNDDLLAKLKPLAAEADAVLDSPMGEGPNVPPSDLGAELPAEPELMEDAAGGEAGGPNEAAVLAERLGVSDEHAQALYDAAMSRPDLSGISAEELADMLDADLQLRMLLEKEVAKGQDAAFAEGPAPELPEAPPEEGNPGVGPVSGSSSY